MAEREYLTVAEALAAVLGLVAPLPAETVDLGAALGRTLVAPVVARDSLPPFDNSSMDGYALRAADSRGASRTEPVALRVVGDLAAGAPPAVTIAAGEAARIMTGAPIPPGADAVIPVEETDEPYRVSNRPLPASVRIFRAVESGDYLRRAGEDIEAGTVVLPAGHRLRPQEIGVLAALGVPRVPVIRRPRVGILATGDELIAVDQPLGPGKIRNSNSYAQAAQVQELGAVPVDLGAARDTAADVRARLEAGISAGIDLIVSSAGVSVGAYDVVKEVLQSGGGIQFWKVRMRPGKPLAVGRYGGVPFLGLPGNPVSAMVSFERFARPAILRMMGAPGLERPQVAAMVEDGFTSDGRESYIRAVVSRAPGGEYRARTTGSQGSHILTSLVKANALLVVPEGVVEVPAGTTLQALMIDWPATVF